MLEKILYVIKKNVYLKIHAVTGKKYNVIEGPY